MRTSRWLPALVIALLALFPPSPGRAQSVKESLLAEANGEAVLLALDASGQLVALVRGKPLRVLAKGPYGGAARDDARELVWLRGRRTLDVVDLRAKTPSARTIVTFPDNAMEGLGKLITEPPTWAADSDLNVMLDTPCDKGTGLSLDWRNTLGASGESQHTWAKGFKVADKAWLTAQLGRPTVKVPATIRFPKGKKLRIPGDVGTCKQRAKESEYARGRCGDRVPFGATSLELVITTGDEDECPASQCHLYEPASKRYFDPPGVDRDAEPSVSCGPYLFDRSGRIWAVGDKLCPGGSCHSVGITAIGWLDGSVEVNLD